MLEICFLVYILRKQESSSKDIEVHRKARDCIIEHDNSD